MGETEIEDSFIFLFDSFLLMSRSRVSDFQFLIVPILAPNRKKSFACAGRL
jgi:hypothetical protein